MTYILKSLSFGEVMIEALFMGTLLAVGFYFVGSIVDMVLRRWFK